jgi:DNA-binding protein
MESYTKVKRQRDKPERNEIMVSKKGAVNQSYRYAMRVLKEKDTDDSFKYDRIVIRASGNAIKKAIMLVEDIKNKHGNLH